MKNDISPAKQKLYKRLMSVRPTILVALIKSIAHLKRTVVTSSEGKFWIDPISHMGQAVLEDYYEPSVQEVIKSHLHSGQTFIDVGANEGFYTVIASRLVGPQGRVVAIEPQNRLIPIIKENAKLNDCQNVTIIAAALSDGSSQQTQIWLSPS